MAELDQVGTYRRYAYDRLSPAAPFRGYFGRRLMGIIALGIDAWMEAATQAVRAHWINDNPPPDGVSVIGEEVLLERYSTETDEQFQDRVARAWEDWEQGGTDAAVIGQLAAAGFPGAQIFRWSGGGSWSEFTVFFPEGLHTVTSEGPAVGSFTVGDGTIIGPVGITAEGLATIKGIILKWKPGRWVCRQIAWELSGWTVGSGHSLGEGGLVIGGAQARTKVQ